MTLVPRIVGSGGGCRLIGRHRGQFLPPPRESQAELLRIQRQPAQLQEFVTCCDGALEALRNNQCLCRGARYLVRRSALREQHTSAQRGIGINIELNSVDLTPQGSTDLVH